MASRPTSLTNVDVVTFVVAFLGGLDRPVHLERVAMKAYELSPGAFRWDRDEYAEFVDKDKVRVSLTDAEKPSAGSLVKGVGPTTRGPVKRRKGVGSFKRDHMKRTDLWRLTAAGSEWIAINADRVSVALGETLPKVKKSRANQIRHQLSESALYHEYASAGKVDYSPYDFTDLLACSPDAAFEVVQERWDKLRGEVILLRDPDLNRFVEVCGAAHARILGNVK